MRNRSCNMMQRLFILMVAILSCCFRSGSKSNSSDSTKASHAAKHGQRFLGDTLPPPAAQGKPQSGGILRLAMEAEPPSLNSQLDPLDTVGKRIHALLNESLARPNPKTWKLEPRLATSWQIADNGLVFTFSLRPGVRWHDGQPFSADDVVFSFNKILDPTSRTIIKRSYLRDLESVRKIDDMTVEFRLKRPYRFALDAIGILHIYPKHRYQKGDFNTHPLNRAPVGTGKYKFVRWKRGEEIVIARNNDYFGRRAHVDKIVFRYVPDPAARIQMLRRGELDVVLRVSPDVWQTLAQDDDIRKRFWRLRHVPNGLQWVGWNQSRPMFQDLRVRQALTMLVDRSDIVNNLRYGLDEQAASWFYPRSAEHHPELTPLPHAPGKAQRLLANAGWKDTDGDGVLDQQGKPFAFTFLYPSGSPFYEQLASLLHTQLKSSGIRVNSQRLEWTAYLERLRKRDFDACSMLWQLEPRSDPFQIWHSSAIQGGSNFIGFSNPEADAIILSARQDFDDEQRLRKYRRLAEILHAQQPYTMLFYRYNLTLVSKALGGIESTPYGILRVGDLYRRTPATRTTSN